MEKTFNNLRKIAYKMATDHGFHDEKHSIKHYKCLIISELMGAVEADRQGRFANPFAFCNQSNKVDFTTNFENNIKDTVADELADACIRIFDLAGCTNTDLDIKVNKPKLASESFPEMVFEVCQELMIYSAYSLTRSLLLIYQIAELRDVDLDWHIELKMKYNSTRPRLHNKQY